MAMVYDISSRLTNEKPTIKVAEGHIYEVNNSKNQAIFIKTLTEDKSLTESELMDKIIEAGLGKDALDYINIQGFSMAEYSVIMNAIMAAISEEKLEDIEKLAEQEVKKAKKK